MHARSNAALLVSIGFTQWAQRTAFTRPAITPPKVNRFGWNLERCDPSVGDWPWQTLGEICTVATVWEEPKFCFFSCQINNAQFHLISRRTIFTNFAHNNVDRCRDVNFPKQFWKFYHKGSFFQKTLKFLEHFQILATSGCQNSAMITDCRKLTTKINLYGMSSFHFRSTPPIRPNNAGLKCPSISPSVRPQKVSSISMKFGI